MAESVTLLSLPKMCDLALNTPEVGVVNFTVLHSLLQVMINQLNLADTSVEFRGTDSERIQQYMSSSGPINALTLTQYTTIAGADHDEKLTKKRVSIDGDHTGKDHKTDKTVTKKEIGSRDQSLTAAREGSENKSKIILIQSSRALVDGGAQFGVSLTKENFDELQSTMKDMENRIKELEGLPGNDKIMNALMTDGNDKTPILDMYQILSLQKRMDAVDEGMEKLASMVESVARGSLMELDVGSKPKLTTSVESESSSLRLNLKERIENIEKALMNLGQITQPSGESTGAADSPVATSTPRPSTATSRSTSARPSSTPAPPSTATATKAVKHAPTITGGGNKFDGTQDLEKIDISKLPITDAISLLKSSLMDLKRNIKAMPQLLQQVEELNRMLTASSDAQPVEMRIAVLETRCNEFLDQIQSLDGGFSRQVTTLQNRVNDLEREVGEMLEKVHLIPEEVDAKGQGQVTSELYGHLTTLQDDFQRVSDTVNKLSDEYASKQHNMEILTEQIELLRTVKADREDLEDALADKADACQINRKVSFEQFDQACGDMSKSLEEALAKLTQQENLWNQALDNIQNSMGGKLDKIELNPLKDFINGKLKSLQEKFKTLNALKREHEAAGTKSKYLRNVNCISCDKDVVMRKEMDSTLYPKPYAVPPTRSMGPYLAYELDQLRKQQKCLPNSKNMNNFENALQTSRSARSPDHVCNRYCGGSHTVTTPQQRVTRLGHFLEQWGPEIAPVNDTQVRGTDGRLYKARDDQQLKQLATERPPTPHVDNKPVIFISSENTPRKATKDEIVSTRTSFQPNQDRISTPKSTPKTSVVPKSGSATKAVPEPGTQ